MLLASLMATEVHSCDIIGHIFLFYSILRKNISRVVLQCGNNYLVHCKTFFMLCWGINLAEKRSSHHVEKLWIIKKNLK